MSLEQSGGGNVNGLGTSVLVSANGSADFSIGGVPGVYGTTNYVINAFMDTIGTGMQYATVLPGHQDVPFDSSDVTGIDFNLSSPDPAVVLWANIPDPYVCHNCDNFWRRRSGHL